MTNDHKPKSPDVILRDNVDKRLKDREQMLRATIEKLQNQLDGLAIARDIVLQHPTFILGAIE